jgi:hypothetical protein
MGNRGELTGEAIALGNKLLGFDMTKDELRMLPFIQYCVMNSGAMDVSRINGEDRAILSNFLKLGFLTQHLRSTGDVIDVRVTKDFWDKMNEILWLTYAGNLKDL